MFKSFSHLSLIAGIFSFTCVFADDPGISDAEKEPALEEVQVFTETVDVISPNHIESLDTLSEPAPLPVAKPLARALPRAVEKTLNPFTGKVKAKKVRIRTGADFDSPIFKEVKKNELVTVVGEKSDFYAILPPAETKGFVFRTFILDNVVEGSRVNIRLYPSKEAPVIGHLSNGETISGTISQENSKWYEIALPSTCHFYVAKELIEKVGGPEYKVQYEARLATASKIFQGTTHLAQTEMQKPYPDIDFTSIRDRLQTVISDYPEFTELAQMAKNSLATLEEEYIQKKVAFINDDSSYFASRNSFSGHKKEQTLYVKSSGESKKHWEAVENALYATWASQNENGSSEEFYEEQAASATIISGRLERYTDRVQNKPGEFKLLNKNNVVIACVYSTKVNLDEYLDKKVKLKALERPNNNFAFPAYFVLDIVD